MQNSKNLSKNLDKAWQEVRQTLIEKNSEYGNSFFETADIYGSSIVCARLYDKLNRLNSLARKLPTNKSKRGRKKAQDDSIQDELHSKIRDTILDLTGYGVLSMIYFGNKESEQDFVGSDEDFPDATEDCEEGWQ